MASVCCVAVVGGEVKFVQRSGLHEQGLGMVGLKVTGLPTKLLRGNGPYSSGHVTGKVGEKRDERKWSEVRKRKR